MAPMFALILAAGAGSRLGAPKSRLLVGGVPLALLHVRRAREAGCERIVVVTRRADRAWLEREAAGASGAFDVVVSDEPEQSGSLRVGVRSLENAAENSLVLVTPVDALPARADTIRALVKALAEGTDAVSPTTNKGVGGHPVILRTSVLRGAYGEGAPPLRDVLNGLGPRRLRLEVDDPAIATNLDTPADVRAATGAEPLFFEPGA